MTERDVETRNYYRTSSILIAHELKALLGKTFVAIKVRNILSSKVLMS